MSKKAKPPTPDQYRPGATYRVREADWSAIWGEQLQHVDAVKLKSKVVGERKSTTAVIEDEVLGPPPELEERAIAARAQLRATPVMKYRVREADWSKVWGEDLIEAAATQLKNKVVGERKSKSALVESMNVTAPYPAVIATLAGPVDPQLAQIQSASLAQAGDIARAAQARADAVQARQKAVDDARRAADEADAEAKKILAELDATEGEAAEAESFMSKMVRDLSPEEKAELEASQDDEGGLDELINGGGDVPTDEEVKATRARVVDALDEESKDIAAGDIVAYFPSENVRDSGMAVVVAVKVASRVLNLHTGVTPAMLDGKRLIADPTGPVVEGVMRRDLSEKTTNTWSLIV